MKNYYAIESDFSNRFTVAAFATRAARDTWVAEMNRHPSVQARAVSRKEARHLLSPGYLSPGDLDYRISLGCYLGSRNLWTDAARREEAVEAARDAEMNGVLPDGVPAEPVRL